MRALYILLVAALLALCSFPAMAQTPPPAPKEYGIVSPTRLALAAGAQYDWNAGATTVASEFAAGAHAGYVLTTHLSLAAHAIYGFDSQSWRVVPSLHYRVPDGVTKTGSVAFELAYQYFGGSNIPAFQHEWAAGAIWAMPLTSRILLGASEVYGFDNKVWRTSVGLQLPLWFGKES
ncbi:MAG TPA: hypothetical protein VN903_28580 [Polyangia bacterium]|nr:hypothetical protein [Polyangia bacterium]